jgi:hypothetical protein
MSIIKKLKLYRVKTVLLYIVKSWENSAFVIVQSPESKRLTVYFDLIWSFVKLGADFNDYCTFSFWNKNRNEKDSFITLRRNDKLRFSFSTPRVYNLFLDKDAFNRRFSKWVKRGFISTNEAAWKEIADFIERYDAVIAKPLTDYGGHGVMKLDKSSSGYSEKLNELRRIIELEKGRYIIEEVIENTDNIKRIAPSSLNTIRLVTVIDNSGELHIIASLLRMGNGKANTDNYHDGGMACEIDLDKCELKGIAKGMNCVKYEKHPFSGIQFNGFPVPEIKQCVEIINEVAFTEPEARYVGWDFAVTPKGVELLEGNIPPGEDITQLNLRKGYWYQMLKWK